MDPVVSVIVVNWNGLSHLPDCLGSLEAQSYSDFEVVFVDNGSTDDSLAYVAENHPSVKIVPLPENVGFASGNNLGFKQATGKYIVTLNNDTRLAPDWLEQLVCMAEKHPDAGMIGSRICSFEDPDLIDSLSIGICQDGMSRGRYRRQRWSELALPDDMEILFPSACAALYRRDMIEKIGFFDDDFFAYAEDSDLGLRGRLSGWPAFLAADAVVYHKYSQSTGHFSALKVYLVERNHYWVAVKNFPLKKLLFLPFFTVLRYFEQGRAILQGGGSGREFRASGNRMVLIKALGQGIFDSLKGLPRMLKKRHEVMQGRKLSTREFEDLLRQHRLSFKELLDNN